MSERDDRRALDALRRLSDEELADVAARGDEAAARVLLERFEEPLYRYTVALVRDPDLAREATWSALFEAARAVRLGEHSEPVAPWIFRVAQTAADVAGGRPNGAEHIAPEDDPARRAAAAAGPDRERLETLLARLDALPERDRGSLLLRELVGLEYVGIATVTGARPAAARQSVFRARQALQGDADLPTEHCSEIQAAMSKAEEGIRERRSIATHLETCPACEAFAVELERRPADLRTLFPGPEEPLAAELVPPLPPVAAGAAAAGAAGGVAAAAGARQTAWTGGGSGRDGGDRGGRRRALVPLMLLLLLAGAAVATALALNDNGGGKKGRATAAREGKRKYTEVLPGKPAKKAKKHAKHAKAKKHAKATKPAKPRKPAKPAKPKPSTPSKPAKAKKPAKPKKHVTP
ncbi:MAG: hypothetical protein QOG41_2537, partial [Thermoleophilaceae bacterium]|nr:hypothetical protein [Thermoleophilaceae bacterium]